MEFRFLEMLKISPRSAFRPVKCARVEPNDLNDDRQQDNQLVSDTTIPVRRKVAYRSRPSEIPKSPSHILRIKGLRWRPTSPDSSSFFSRRRSQVVIRYGDCNVVAVNRIALQRAVPDLTRLESFRKFRFLVIPTEVFADLTHVNAQSMKCFTSLCEAMYIRDAPLLHFDEPDLQGAWEIARTLRANGIMVLCEHLLRDRHSAQA